MVMQCLGAIFGAGIVKGFQPTPFETLGGGANVVNPGYSKGDGLGAEIVETFALVYTVLSATDAKRSARDSHVPILASLPIGFAVFLVHLATIPITGTGINPARSLGAAIVYNEDCAWYDHVSTNIAIINCYVFSSITNQIFAFIYHDFKIKSLLQWIFWVRPFIGAALAALSNQIVIRAIPFMSKA
ncbi:hypothetical protein P3X46_003693 [Hevea brasiliensis]|uniref:Uncharacterized protein n=1 Tax=Hevea brasiliensis TaxID=3981 RepID=A0ABQ9N725_HEVBR|nr:hypothetical protein P3X46_003693 [Hevea brasiliensis]